MKPVASRLLVFGLLYASWMAYLGYLVLTRPLTPAAQPLVLSRPQIDTSEVDVIAELPAPAAATPEGTEVTVKQVLASQKGNEVQEGQTLRVLNLEDCRPYPRGTGAPPLDWTGPGLYLLPLRSSKTPTGKVVYEVAPVPPSPGYGGGPPRIYPAAGPAQSKEVQAQYARIRKPE